MWHSLEPFVWLLPIFVSRAVAQSNNTAPFANVTSPLPNNVTVPDPPYWLEGIKHQGVAPFQNGSNYQTFRNVKDYGAKGWNSTHVDVPCRC